MVPLMPQRFELLHESYIFIFASVNVSLAEYVYRELVDSEYYTVIRPPTGTPMCQSSQAYASPKEGFNPFEHAWLQFRTFGKLQKFRRGDRIVEDVYIINPVPSTMEEFANHLDRVCDLLKQPDARGSITAVSTAAYTDNPNQVVPTYHGLFNPATILAISRFKEVEHIRYKQLTGEELLEAAKEK
ncbi:hypothetical protein CGLO_09716 [Colletotrichum gloeosporioides Cg-14]|uniref:Uncharacterized protein n=1 Tax=Colletotrichum gloeosporioides (strain Cg-14) TaxID=1237896 RepID=T0LRE2_COLGC|nr:hypothetical protein CGLO_09716 [Colletotrichum gloeosporioides Cg-14]